MQTPLAEAVVDLAAVKEKVKRLAATPTYDPGTPEFIQQVGVHIDPAQPPSFNEALNLVATNLGIDGWSVLEVKSCVLLGINTSPDGVENVAVFQVTAKVRRSAS